MPYNIGSDQNIRVNALQLTLIEIAKIDCLDGGNRPMKPSKHIAIYIKRKMPIVLSSTLLRMYSVTSLQ